MPVVAVGEPLREKLGEEAVDSLIDLINQSLASQKNDVVGFTEEKFERRLSEEIGKLDNSLSAKIADVEVRLSEKIVAGDKRLWERISEVETKLSKDIFSVEAKLSKEIAATRSDVIKWMFIFWVGQMGIILSILFTFFRKLL